MCLPSSPLYDVEARQWNRLTGYEFRHDQVGRVRAGRHQLQQLGGCPDLVCGHPRLLASDVATSLCRNRTILSRSLELMTDSALCQSPS